MMRRGLDLLAAALSSGFPIDGNTRPLAAVVGGKPPRSRRTVAQDKRAARKRRNVMRSKGR